MKGLCVAVKWFTSQCAVVPSLSDTRMAVLEFGPFTLILDAASDNGIATIGFNSADCDTDFATKRSLSFLFAEPEDIAS